MVQGDRVKGTKASSAKAAQLLGSAAAAQPVAVGFGGYAQFKPVLLEALRFHYGQNFSAFLAGLPDPSKLLTPQQLYKMCQPPASPIFQQTLKLPLTVKHCCI